MHEYKLIESGKPLKEAKNALILIHGRGGTAESIIPLAEEFPIEDCYIVAPQATGNTWYPYSFLAPEKQNEPWLSSAVDTIKRLISEISEHIPQENIYLMGFSQGACLTAEVAAQVTGRFAGVASFTGGLIGDSIKKDRYEGGDFKGTPFFIGTSDVDPHIPVKRAEETRDMCESLGANVVLKVYENMPHTIIQDEITTVKEMMNLS